MEELKQLQSTAEELLRQGQHAMAYPLYLQLAKRSPQQEDYRLRLAEICVALKRPQDAIRLYKHLAANFIQHGKVVQAISVNRRILEIDPNELEIQKRLADIYADVVDDPQKSQRQEAQREVQALASAPLELASSAKTSADYDDVFDVSSNLQVAGANTNVDLSIGGHDGYNVVDYSAQSQSQDHLTLMGAPPPRVTPAIPLFADLPPKAFDQLMQKFEHWSSPPDTTLVRQGDPGDSIFIICYGRVNVLRKAGDQVRKISQLQAGDFFGEFAYFSKRPREASLVSETAVEVLELTRSHIDEIIFNFPKVERAMQNLYKQRVLDNLVRESPLFSPLSELERKQFLTKFTHRQASAGQCIIREGDVADSFYVIQCGSVKVIQDGVSEPLAILKEGEFFGEYAMITGQKRNASIVAVEKTDLVSMTKEVFVELLKSKPQVWAKVKEIAQKRLSENQTRLQKK